MRVIVGLGNPGLKYRNTRHNLGFMVIEELSRELKVKLKKSLILKAKMARAYLKNEALLVCPVTFMNLSGRSVRRIIEKFSLSLKDLLLICDDVNLPLGKLRIRARGSSGGHKGVLSVISSLESEEFCRLRMGVGGSGEEKLEDFVLGDFKARELEEMSGMVARAKQAALDWIDKGCKGVMDIYN